MGKRAAAKGQPLRAYLTLGSCFCCCGAWEVTACSIRSWFRSRSTERDCLHSSFFWLNVSFRSCEGAAGCGLPGALPCDCRPHTAPSLGAHAPACSGSLCSGSGRLPRGSPPGAAQAGRPPGPGISVGRHRDCHPGPGAQRAQLALAGARPSSARCSFLWPWVPPTAPLFEISAQTCPFQEGLP